MSEIMTAPIPVGRLALGRRLTERKGHWTYSGPTRYQDASALELVTSEANNLDKSTPLNTTLFSMRVYE